MNPLWEEKDDTSEGYSESADMNYGELQDLVKFLQKKIKSKKSKSGSEHEDDDSDSSDN